uniref:Uncharacterized protein n=1 Tax=Opuntia streptacantha TaxID=393608 RepID=A0A7C9DZ48_OPUST
MDGLAGDGAEPGRPTGSDMLTLYILLQIPESKTHRLTPTRGVNPARVTPTHHHRVTSAVEPLLLRRLCRPHPAPTRPHIIPKNARMVHCWGHTYRTLGTHTTHHRISLWVEKSVENRRKKMGKRGGGVHIDTGRFLESKGRTQISKMVESSE